MPSHANNHHFEAIKGFFFNNLVYILIEKRKSTFSFFNQGNLAIQRIKKFKWGRDGYI